MKKGIRGHDVERKGLKLICERCREVGIDYVQLVCERSVEGFEFGKFTKEYALDIKAQLGDTKIAVLGSYINPSNADSEALRYDLDRFKEKIRYATYLNPILVGTETCSYKDGENDSEEAYAKLLCSIKELAAEAEKHNVTIGIEGVHFHVINKPEKLAKLIGDVKSDNVKAIFDPCNYITINNYTEQDAMINTMFDLLGDKIEIMHAKDFVVEDGAVKSAVPGEGMLNYKLIFERMKEYNLDVPIICEEINENDAARAFENLEKIRESLN